MIDFASLEKPDDKYVVKKNDDFRILKKLF